MKIRIRYMRLLYGLAAAAFALGFGSGKANAQVPQPIVPGEVLVLLPAGNREDRC